MCRLFQIATSIAKSDKCESSSITIGNKLCGVQVSEILKMSSWVAFRATSLVESSFFTKKSEQGKILHFQKIHVEIRDDGDLSFVVPYNSRLIFSDSFFRLCKYKAILMRWRTIVVFTLEHCSSIVLLAMD